MIIKYFGYNSGIFTVTETSKAEADRQAIARETSAANGNWPELKDEFGNVLIPAVRIATVEETQK